MFFWNPKKTKYTYSRTLVVTQVLYKSAKNSTHHKQSFYTPKHRSLYHLDSGHHNIIIIVTPVVLITERAFTASRRRPPLLPLKMRTRPLRMRRITWPVSGPVRNSYIFWNPRFLYFIKRKSFIGLRCRLRVVYSRPCLTINRYSYKILSPVKIRSKVAIFGENGGLNIEYFFLSPKRKSIRAIASFDVFCARICVYMSAVDDWKEPVPPKKLTKPLIQSNRYPNPYANFGDDRFRCFGVVVGIKLPSSPGLESSLLLHSCTTTR